MSRARYSLRKTRVEKVRRRLGGVAQPWEQSLLCFVPRHDVPAVVEHVCRIGLELFEQHHQRVGHVRVEPGQLIGAKAGEREQVSPFDGVESKRTREGGEHLR
jgi:hypothetical protein